MNRTKSNVLSKSGKEKFLALPGLHCLANATGKNTAPSGVFLNPVKLSLVRSADLDGRVKASNMTIHKVKFSRDRLIDSLRDTWMDTS